MTTAISNPAAQIFQIWLIAEALGVDPDTDDNTNDWPIFIGILPDSNDVKDNAIAVHDSTPIKDGRIQATGETILHHGIQVMVRGSDYLTAHAKIVAIRNVFDTLKNVAVTAGGTNYTIKQISHLGIIPLGTEEEIRRRVRFTLNGISTISE